MFREFKSLSGYFVRYRTPYILGFTVLVIVDGAQMLIPQWIKRAVNIIVTADYHLREVLFCSLAMIATMAVIAAGRFLWRYFIYSASRRIEAELRDRLFGRLLDLDYTFYLKNKTGDLMARATNDLGAVRMAIGFGLVALVDGTAMALCILVIIFIQDWQTALYAVLPLPLITGFILVFGAAVGKRFGRVQSGYSTMSEVAEETFAGINVVKSFVKENWFVKKFAEANDAYKAANMSLAKLFGALFPAVSFLAGITALIVLYAGGRRVIQGAISPGSLVALLAYFQMLIWPVLGAGFTVNLLQRGAVSLGRINAVLTTEPLIIRETPPPLPCQLAGASNSAGFPFLFPGWKGPQTPRRFRRTAKPGPPFRLRTFPLPSRPVNG